MLLTIHQKEFFNGIQIVQRAVSSKSTLPILKGIYLEAVKNKGLHLIANDLEIGIEYWVKAEIEEEGSIVLPAAQLISIIRELPAAEINFEADLEHYQVNLKCLNSEFNLRGYQADEFPQLPEVEGSLKLNLSSRIFSDMINEVKFATANDQSQPSLTGGLILINDNSINIIATNTYRLAYSKFGIETGISGEINSILPGNTLNELANLLTDEDDISILLSQNYVRFNFNDIVLISRLIEGRFPNFRQVIPNDFKTMVKVDRDELLKSVKRVSLIARLGSNVITMEINKDQMNIYSHDSDYGHAHEILEIETSGIDQKIDIDADYLIDVLRVLNEDVLIINLISSLNSLTIKKLDSDNYTYLIMPVRPGA